MLHEELKNLPVFDRFKYWITERESIRLKRLEGLPAPWTEDPFLQKYRYCNVRRMDDKVSDWLLQNWYKPNFGHKNMLLAGTLARQFNRIEAFEAMGFPKTWNPARIDKILHKRAAEGKKNFGGAYMTTGTLGGTKIHQMIWLVTDVVHKKKVKLTCDSVEETVGILKDFPGSSTFMAGQITADLVFALPGRWEDVNTWTPQGPGSSRGLLRLHGMDHTKSLKPKEFRPMFEEYLVRMKEALPESISSRLNAQDYQSTLCECDKFSRLIEGHGKPKQKYPGTGL